MLYEAYVINALLIDGSQHTADIMNAPRRLADPVLHRHDWDCSFATTIRGPQDEIARLASKAGPSSNAGLSVSRYETEYPKESTQSITDLL